MKIALYRTEVELNNLKKKVETLEGIIESNIHQGLSKHQEVSSTPLDESEKNDCGFLGPPWSNKKINPQTYVPCGSYELWLSNVAHHMKEKLTIQFKFSHFLSQLSLKFEICTFFSG